MTCAGCRSQQLHLRHEVAGCRAPSGVVGGAACITERMYSMLAGSVESAPLQPGDGAHDLPCYSSSPLSGSWA